MQISDSSTRTGAGDQVDYGAHVPVVQSTSPDSPPLIFVTGAARSGTTMLSRMLGSHSAIMAFNELHYFGGLWNPYDTGREISGRELAELAAILLARQTFGLWGSQPTDVERAWGRRLVRNLPAQQCTPAGLFAAVLQRLAEDAGKTLACEQTPRNIFYAKRLLQLYPNARIVHIVRDPRAVLASQKNRWKLRRLGASHLPMSEMLRNRVNYHPITMGKLWARATEEALQLVGRSQFMIVRFEDLAADSEGGARRLCGFLGLQFESGMLDIPRWGSSNVEHDSEQKGISREVENKWRDILSPGEALICEKITHRIMQRFGYSPEFLGHYGFRSTVPSLMSYPLHLAGVLALNPRRAWIQFQAMWRARGAGLGTRGKRGRDQ
jgi:omega-hydroxy-beta-dihydromenaquinone-9 sulfotransferase